MSFSSTFMITLSESTYKEFKEYFENDKELNEIKYKIESLDDDEKWAHRNMQGADDDEKDYYRELGRINNEKEALLDQYVHRFNELLPKDVVPLTREESSDDE